MDQNLLPGDIFLTRGTGFISAGIRFFSRLGGESRTEVNHSGIVVEAGSFETATIVEANRTVERHNMGVYRLSKKNDVAIFRSKTQSDENIAVITEKAESYVGRQYGYIKIVAHFLDWCLGGRYVFRRLARMDKYPICSWVVAYSYEAVDFLFGVPAWAASPDDIWDYCIAHPEEFEVVWPLGTLP